MERVGPYQILSRIGKGGMGEVFKARDTRLDRLVALKFLTPELHRDPDAEARFAQEAKAASALEHPNVGTIYDVGSTKDGRRWIAMAFYDGYPLNEVMDAAPLPLERALDMVLQTAEGLAKAHQKGIVHRDIKPSNLILTEDGLVKILDFGLAKLTTGDDGLTRSGTSMGTPSYMSPEQVRGDAADSRADVWSLGVLLYHMLSDRVPFKGDSMQSTMYAVLEKEPEPLPDTVPGDLHDLVISCLHKDREHRPPNAGGVADALKRHLGRSVAEEADQTVAMDSAAHTALMDPAANISPAPASGKPGGRSVVRRLGLAVALMVAGIVAIVLLREWDSEPGLAQVRVAVATPTVTGDVDSLGAMVIASNVEVAVTQSLASLLAVSPVGAKGVDEDQALAVLACQELLTTEVRADPANWNLRLTRRDSSGAVLWTENLIAPRERSLILARAIEADLSRAYPNRISPQMREREVREEDYDEFLHLVDLTSRDTGEELSSDEILDRLASIRESSPGFLPAYIQEMAFLRREFDLTRDTDYLDRAFRVGDRAREIAPEDSRVPASLAALASRRGDWVRADAELTELERLESGSVGVLIERGNLAWRQGDLEAAVVLYREAAERGAPQVGRYYLAQLEYQLGNVTEARAVLGDLLASFPDYSAARSLVAEMELMVGDISLAEGYYADLVAEDPNGARLTNLGLARFLQGKYAEAGEAYSRAESVLGRDSTLLLNLADVRQAEGQTSEAQRLYREVISLVEADPEAESVDNRILRAQCLAQIGDDQAAVAEVQALLVDSPNYSEARYAAALVYSLIGERTSALVHAEAALEQGVEPRWFNPPWFRELREDPRFQALVGRL